MNLARFPRLRFGHLPTPLEPLKNLTRELGGPEVWIKRDDCTGMSTGGNKTRKLEFLMAQAQEEDAREGTANRTWALTETWHPLPQVTGRTIKWHARTEGRSVLLKSTGSFFLGMHVHTRLDFWPLQRSGTSDSIFVRTFIAEMDQVGQVRIYAMPLG